MAENNIRIQRRRRGMTQTELARQMGVSQQSVTKWETQDTVPGFKHVIALSRILGTDPGELFPVLKDGSTPKPQTNLLLQIEEAMTHLEVLINDWRRANGGAAQS